MAASDVKEAAGAGYERLEAQLGPMWMGSASWVADDRTVADISFLARQTTRLPFPARQPR